MHRRFFVVCHLRHRFSHGFCDIFSPSHPEWCGGRRSVRNCPYDRYRVQEEECHYSEGGHGSRQQHPQPHERVILLRHGFEL